MENNAPEIARAIMSLEYAHREGGKYAYVKFLSLIRDLSSTMLAQTPGGERLISEVRERMNLALESRFTEAEEKYFYESRTKVLQLIAAAGTGISSAAPPGRPPLAELASAVAAL